MIFFTAMSTTYLLTTGALFNKQSHSRFKILNSVVCASSDTTPIKRTLMYETLLKLQPL